MYRDGPLPIEQTESWLAWMWRRVPLWLLCAALGLISGAIAFRLGFDVGRRAPPLPPAAPCTNSVVRLPTAAGARVSCGPDQKSYADFNGGYLFCYCE